MVRGRGKGQSWTVAGAKTLTRILVRMERGANRIWKFSGNPLGHTQLIYKI